MRGLNRLSTALWVALAAVPAARAEGELQEITVTAQRVAERLQDVPIAVTAVSADDLVERGIRQAGDITADVPNMLLNSPYGPEAQPTFTLRGVTTQDFSENQSSPIAMYVDEVYKPVGAVQSLQVYDLDRVEVLRGPQGTLYGKNATGGAVSFYTRNPSLTDYDGYATVGAGNYSDFSLRAAGGGPVIDNELGWRTALYYEKREGWVHSIVPGVEPLNGVDALAGRFTLLAQPTDAFTATLKLSFSRSGGTPYGAHALNTDPAYFAGYIGWFDNGAKYAVHKDIHNDSAALKLEWRLSPSTSLTSVTGYDYGYWYEKSDDGGLPVTLRLDDPNTYFSTVHAFSQELRLTSHPSDAFNWLAGLYYGRESTHATVEFHFFDGYFLNYWAPSVPPTSPAIQLPLYGFDEYNNFDQLKDSRAAFFNLTFRPTATFTLHGGLRFTRDHIVISNFYALEGGLASPGSLGGAPDAGSTWWTQTIGAQPAGYALFTTGLAPQAPLYPDLVKDTNNVSGKAGIDWKPNDAVLTYLSYSVGYRGAAFNGQAFNAPAELTFAAPEKLSSIELGVKSEFWNHRAIFNAAAFHYDYRNQQFLDAFNLPAGGSGFRTVNAPKSRIDGAEFELRLKPTGDLELTASLGLMHSKYEELSLHANSGRICCVGNQLIQAPDYSGSVSGDWRFAHVAAGDFRLFLEGNYYAKQYFDAFNTERIAQGAYGLVNGRLSFGSSGKRGFDLGVWVKNAFNRQYLAYGLNQKDPDTGAIGFDYALVGEPRTYGADVTVRF